MAQTRNRNRRREWQPLPEKGRAREGIRARALVIGALSVAATAMLVTQAEMVLSSVRIGYLQFPPVPWA